MAVTVRTSVGTPTANSYVSVASADQYFDERENNDPWLNTESASTGTLTSTERKGRLLINATRELDRSFRFWDQKYNQGIKGQTTYQNLEFPRTSNLDADSNLFIPDEIKYATYEQALWLLQRQQQRTDENNNIVQLPMIGEMAQYYVRGWAKRQVMARETWPWQ